VKLDRLISILVILLRKERVQAKELAQRFDVSVRTILRDVDAINLSGIPVVTYQGVNGGIGIAEGYRLDRSVLTDHEMAAIFTALKGVSKTMPESQYEILLEKLKNTLSASQLDLLKSRTNHLIIDLSPWGGNELLKQRLITLRRAIENNRELEFDYQNLTGKKTSRRVEPYSLVLKGQAWYLYAWCLLREDFRLFKLSRMRDVTVLETCYQPKELSLDQLSWEKSWQESEPMVELELLFEKEMETIVEECFGENPLKNREGKIIVKTRLPENNWLYGFILSFGTGVEVVSPPGIRAIVANIAQGIAKKYSSET